MLRENCEREFFNNDDIKKEAFVASVEKEPKGNIEQTRKTGELFGDKFVELKKRNPPIETSSRNN